MAGYIPQIYDVRGLSARKARNKVDRGSETSPRDSRTISLAWGTRVWGATLTTTTKD